MRATRTPSARAPVPPGGAVSGQGFASLTWRHVAAGGGFVLVLLGSFMSWVTAGGNSAGAFSENAQFRIADWLSTSSVPIDGLLVVVLAAAGLVLIWAMVSCRIPERRASMFVRELGSVAVFVGILEMQYISSVSDGVSWGIGLYLVVVGGALAVLSPFAPARPIQSSH